MKKHAWLIILTALVLTFASVGIVYDKKRCSTADIVSDHLDFHAALLNEAGALWNELVGRKIAEIDKEIADLAARNLVIVRLHTSGILNGSDYSAQSSETWSVTVVPGSSLMQDSSIEYSEPPSHCQCTGFASF